MSNTFKTWMQSHYEHNELADIATHGCESGCAGGMIYYDETSKLFDKYKESIFDIVTDYQESMGKWGLGQYVNENCDTFSRFANAMVWTAAEIVAYELTQGEYIEEEVA